MATAGAAPSGGIMGMFQRPEFWQWASGVGGALSRAGAGQGYDLTQANQQLFQSMADRQAQQRLGGLMDQFDLNPQQRALMGELPPDMQRQILAKQAFPSGDMSNMELAWSMLNPEERRQAARIAAGLEAGAGKGRNLGLNIVWGKDAEGNYVPMQADPSGGLRAAEMPEGVQPVPPYALKFIDTGTGTVAVDARTGMPVSGAAPEAAPDAAGGYIPKDVAGEAEARERGKMAPEQEEIRRKTVENGQTTIAAIDSLLNDPELDRVVGPLQGAMPNITGGSRRVMTKIGNLKGKAFLEAFSTLKGGGQITEREGAAATAAMTRLGDENAIYMDNEDFRQALMELRNIIDVGIRRAKGENIPDMYAAKQQYERTKVVGGKEYGFRDGNWYEVGK